ncbi:MAG: LamG domain-containing protein, partial [Planctomycetes bacterium]|nr:LamG domain-containing protein [Planctomycetota bacterium]
MWKKFIYLTLSVFLLSVLPAGSANAADPNLVLWLEFEGNADDSSDYGRPTTVTGSLTYGPGVIGEAADLAGNANYVTITGWKGILGQSAFTVSAWCLPDAGNDGCFAAWGTHHSGSNENRIGFRSNGDRLRVEHGNGNLQGDTVWNQDGEWHHVALTHAAGTNLRHPNTKLYLDGWDDTRLTTGDDSTTNIQAEFDVRIGIRHSEIARNLDSWFDDVRIYDRELSANEIRILAGNVEPILLEPADEALVSKPSALLKWMAGVYAADVNGHEVYLGDNYEDVNAGAGGMLVGTTGGSGEFFFVTPLDVGNVYYWKVNAVNDLHPDTPWTSEIWSFTVPDVTGWAPSPADGAGFIDVNPTLEWQAGLYADLQEVYFGDSFEDVNDGTGDTAKGEQPDTRYSPVGPLANDTTYFWRIDTVTGGGTVTGPVWSFTTEPDLPITEPNLVGYWKMDINEPTGTMAVDHSGYDNHGRIHGDAQFVTGYVDEAIQLDGDGDYVSIDGYKGITGGTSRTMCMWIKTADAGGPAPGNGRGLIGWGTGADGRRWELVVNKQSASGRTVDALRVNVDSGTRTGQTVLTDSTWHHVAVILYDDGSPDADELHLYVDGAEETYSHTLDEPIDTGSNFDVRIGNGVSGTVLFYGGLIDEVQLYDRALSVGEVQSLMDPSRAYGPSPHDGARDVPVSAKLTWNPGTDESTGNPYTRHDVYLSENFEDVNSGTVPTATVTDVNEYTPTALDYYKYYYWRIDGVNASGEAYRGWIWSFKATYDPAQIVDPNLRAWYKLDGDATDSSGYGRDLIVTGEPLYAGGVEDLAMELDDVDDWAVYEFPTEEWLEYTVMAWAKLDALPADNYETVFSSYGTTNTSGFQIDVNDATDTYRFNNVGPDEDGTFGPITTEWVHLAVAYDGARATLFYNGSYVAPVVNTAEGTFNQFGIGITRNRGTGRFGGKIDDVRVYDRELFDAEIRKAMRGDNLARAWKPKPGHGATGVELEPTL